MRVALGVVLCAASFVGCGQAERSPAGSGGSAAGAGRDESGAGAGPNGTGAASGRGGGASGNAGAGSSGVTGATSGTSGATGTGSGGGAAAGAPGAGGQGSGLGGDSAAAGAAGSANDDYLYCSCDCCRTSGVVDNTTCYFPDVAGDLDRVKADEAAKRALGQCTGENCGFAIPYRACAAAEPEPEPQTAQYSHMSYVGGIDRVYVTKQVGQQCTRLELTNERLTPLRTAVETTVTWKVTSALLSPCSGQSEHLAIGVSGTLAASGGSDACLLDLHVTAFFTDRQTGAELVKVRFDIDDMQLENVPLACPP